MKVTGGTPPFFKKKRHQMPFFKRVRGAVVQKKNIVWFCFIVHRYGIKRDIILRDYYQGINV